MSPYQIKIGPSVQAQLDLLRAFDHVRILEAIEEQLTHEPLVRTRNLAEAKRLLQERLAAEGRTAPKRPQRRRAAR